jgi:group I intron endonuclease
MTVHLVTFSDESMSRTQKQIIGIYTITSPSGYVYVGQSWNIANRWRGYRKSILKRQPFIAASINKYGLSAHKFEIVLCLIGNVTQSDLDSYEQYYMDLNRSLGRKLMNAREAGSRGRLCELSCAKISRAKRGKKASEAARAALSRAHRGLKKSETHKQNIGLANKGRQSFIDAFRGENNIKAKLSPEQVADIRRRHIPRQKKCNKRLAEEYSVSVSTIERITGRGKGGTWLHI